MTASQSNVAHEHRAMAHGPRVSKFTLLPAELRLNIWACAVQARIVLFEKLEGKNGSYPLPTVTQLNAEARNESRDGYERVGFGSYFNFSRDILVCDHSVTDSTSNRLLETIAHRVERVAFWDCFPDDGRVDGPCPYSTYLSACFRRREFGEVAFDRFWFPNVRDFWIVKVGEVSPAWMVNVDDGASYETKLEQLARQFRYWVHENIIEMAPLDLTDPDTRLVLREGQCGKDNCQELNRGRTRIVSKVTFMDGVYETPGDGNWVRIRQRDSKTQTNEDHTKQNRLRWALVERAITFSLRWEDGSIDTQLKRRRAAQPVA